MSDEIRDKSSVSRKRHSSHKQSSPGEFDFITRIKSRAHERGNVHTALHSSLITHHSSLIKGIGDDAAVIRPAAGCEMVLTADLLVEEIDFRREWMMPRMLGHKALAVSLSDIAAMGARARWALLSIGVPQKIWETDFVENFYEGFFALAETHRVTLIGGDVSRTPEHIVIDSIVAGDVKRNRAVLRTGARAGDHLFVTGTLGGAAAGLKLLEQGARLKKSKARTLKEHAVQELLLKHVQPEPRMSWGALLSEQRLATAMIDLSDGLSSDLAHLCEASGVGARIDAARLPLHTALKSLSEKDFDTHALALNGGEDFELLFTVRPRNLKRMPTELAGVPVTYIGDMTKEKDIKLIKDSRISPLSPSGFKHF
jgi:thiamine-monophosphate kinase